MKKILLRCSALMVAAFVLLGSVLLAAPVKASAAEADRLPELPGADAAGFSYTKYVIWYDSSASTYYAFCFNDNVDFVVYEHNSSHNISVCYYGLTSGGYCIRYSYNSSVDSNWIVDGEMWEAKTINRYSPGDSITPDNIVYTNFDLYFAHYTDVNDFVYDYVFFQQTPLVVMSPLVGIVTDLKEQNQLSQVLTQVVKIIPIGLGCLVGYKGLRKALDLLQRILHQA